ncbi:MAG TPA: TlpA disulfide reductase family protein [Candidatus Deferrimicrobium sp.]|nr:TlpA disulfide reductase family protein [Candidatus Deferrimicrobium sp.]
MRRACCLVLTALLAGACGSSAASSAPATPRSGTRPGDLAPALAGTSLEGRALSLSGLYGSVVVVVFWASWCTPCQAEQPAVNSLAEQEAATGVRFVGVSVDVDRSAAQSYVARFGVPYDSLIDSGQTVVLDYNVAGPPTTFVVDRAGRISVELLGEINPDDLRARIATAAARH